MQFRYLTRHSLHLFVITRIWRIADTALEHAGLIPQPNDRQAIMTAAHSGNFHGAHEKNRVILTIKGPLEPLVQVGREKE